MDFEDQFDNYLTNANQVTNEASKAFQFLHFITNVFSEDANYAKDIFPYLEEHLKVKKGTIAKRGRADALLGNVIIEFKKKLDKKRLSEAKDQLQKYISIIWNREGSQTKYLLFASDGIENKVFRARVVGEEVEEENIELEKLDEIDLASTKPDYARVWLDRYLLYKSLQPPTVEEFVKIFGKESPVYKQSLGLLKDKWEETKDKPHIDVLFDEWKKYLEIVYGEKLGSDLFLRHTYMATLSKLMAYIFYSDGAIPAPKAILSVVSGRAFKEWGIENLFEKDFFSWILRVGEEFTVEFSKHILEHLKSFDLTQLEEDILKGIYQELVDPEERHDLGEYYTPDWLADTIVRKMNASGSFLDSSCGSGTFLASTIRYKKDKLETSEEKLLQTITSSVVGIDVHPVAVITSRVNYLLSLGNLVKHRKGKLYIPVYLADSIKLPKHEISVEGVGVYRFKEGGEALDIPSRLIEPATLDQVLNAIKRVVDIGFDQVNFEDLLGNSLKDVDLEPDEVDVLYGLADKLKQFEKKGRNTIWIYILKNIYRPIYLEKRKFDYIVGNPPWLSYRYASDSYKQFLREQIKNHNLYPTDKPELVTQMELATLFFARTSELYLKESGKIGFVMPRGIYTADQHEKFRRGIYDPQIQFEELVDLDKVKPLFNINSCFIIGKKGDKTIYPVDGKAYIGKLSHKNATAQEATSNINKQPKKWFLNKAGKRTFISDEDMADFTGSVYADKFRQGATIVPRNFWVIDLEEHPRLGFNPKKPYLSTSDKAIKYAKGNYKDVVIQGSVAREFLFATLRGSEIVPFAHLPFLCVVLPCLLTNGKYNVIDALTANNRGYGGLHNWLEEVESEWRQRGGEDRDETAVEWVNYRKKIERQDPTKRFKVLYLTSGKNIAATIVDLEEEALTQPVNGTTIPLKGFVADYMTYYYETEDEDEAHFLCSILNAPYVNDLLKSMQAKGLFGERHICSKVLDLPIPQYNPSNEEHKKLAELGKSCRAKAYDVLPEWTNRYKGIAWIRKGMREDLSQELEEISCLVKNIF